MSKNTRNRILLTALAALLLVVVAVGGTVAYLKASTNTITNTFTSAEVKVELTETWNTDTNGDKENDAWKAQLVPAAEYTKDPKVKITNDTEAYLFVKFEEKNNPSTYLTYTSTLNDDNGWTKLEEQNDVWYRTVKADDTTKEWTLLKDNKITVNNSVTNENMTDAAKAELVYTAYAIQTTGFTSVKDAWTEASKSN